MAPYIRAFCRGPKDDGPNAPITFVASTEGIKRDGLDLKADDWKLDNYKRHPVVLWAHDYVGRTLPIGTGEPRIEGNQLLIDVTYDTEDDFAMQVRAKALKGLVAGSVGWDDVVQCAHCKEWVPAAEWRWLTASTRKECPVCGEKFQEDVAIKHELLEFSMVPVPADPDALPLRQVRAWHDLALMMEDLLAGNHKERKAIPPHTTEKAPEDAPWDGPGEVAKAEAKESVLRRMHAWVDENADPNTKRAYKLPHHRASGEVVWRGVAAAMARLLQAGTQIPDADRRGVYNHLRRHYEQFDREPPEFRTAEELAALGPEEIRGLFLEDEPELFPELFEERAGAVLSARNRQDLERAVELIQGVLRRAAKEDEEGSDERSSEVDQWLAAFYESLQRIPVGGHENE